MKTYILLTTAITLVFTCKTTAQAIPENAPVMSVAEANKLNGVAQPTINGKPYSQYKAEQEALKQQKATKEAALMAQARKQDNDVVPLTPANAAKPAPAKPAEVKMEKTTVAELGKPDKPAILMDAMVAPEQKAKEVPASSVVATNTPANTPTVSLADLPMVTLSAEETQAANKTKEAEAKKQQEITKAISQKPVVPETAKVKSEQDIKNMPAAPKTTEAPVKLEKAPVKEN